MKKLVVLMLSICMVLAFTACRGEEDKISSTASGTESVASPTVSTDDTSSTLSKIPSVPEDYVSPVKVVWFSDSGVKESDCITYNDEKSGAHEAVVFTADKKVTEFKFLEVKYNAVDESFVLGEELYTLSELKPGQALLINTRVENPVSSGRGFCFKDDNGVVVYYYVSSNAIDGSIIVSGF